MMTDVLCCASEIREGLNTRKKGDRLEGAIGGGAGYTQTKVIRLHKRTTGYWQVVCASPKPCAGLQSFSDNQAVSAAPRSSSVP